MPASLGGVLGDCWAFDGVSMVWQQSVQHSWRGGLVASRRAARVANGIGASLERTDLLARPMTDTPRASSPSW